MTTPELHLNNATELIAALPHLLGFVPTDDLVAVLLTRAPDTAHYTTMGAAVRWPITIDEHEAQQLPAACHLNAHQYAGAVLIAVCPPRHHEHALRILRAVGLALQDRGITVHRVLITRTLTAPDHWVDPVTGECGPTMPYTDSPATALGVTDGSVIAASRDDIHREFATIHPAPRLEAEAQDITETLVGDTADDLYRAITQNQYPTSDLAMRAAVVVTAHVGLRDALLRLAVGHELAAGRVWTQIAAAHRGSTRAQLLTMAALAYYCGADTVRAGIALSHADEAVDDPAALPSLTTMLSAALQNGMPPAKIRALIPTRDKAPIPGTNL